MQDIEKDSSAAPPSAKAATLLSVPVERLFPAADGQVRQHFDPGAIETLARSLRRSGVRSPVLVAPLAGRPGDYQIVAGERRWRAAKIAGLARIPCLVDAGLGDPRERLLAQAEENVHRADLNAVEEAAALVRLMEAFDVDAAAAGAMLGRSYQQARRLVQVHQAPAPVKEAIVSGLVDMRAAIELVRIHKKLRRRGGPGHEERSLRELSELIDRVVREGWTIRRLERHAKALDSDGSPAGDATPRKDATSTPSPSPLPAASPGAPWRKTGSGIFIDAGRIARGEISGAEYEQLITILEELLVQVRSRPARPASRWESPRG